MSDKAVEYQGNCHCGAVKFVVTLPELKETTCCDCSYCVKKGVMWNGVKTDSFRFTRGEDHMKSYEFGKGFLSHKFCPTCGVQVIAVVKGASDDKIHLEDLSVNVRCLMGIDPWSLKVNMTHAAACEPRYVPLPFTGTLPSPNKSSPDQKIYTGSCHCGLVRLALATPPLPICTIKEDNCSYCIRHAFTLVYPTTSEVAVTGIEHLIDYSFARRFLKHYFCGNCGTATHFKVIGPPKEVQDRWSDEVREKNRKNFDLLPVNLHVLDRVEWEELKVERDTQEASRPPLYKID